MIQGHDDVSHRLYSERALMTPLDKPLRRLVTIEGKAYTLVLDAMGLRLMARGHRKGAQLLWKNIACGDAAAAPDLDAAAEREGA